MQILKELEKNTHDFSKNFSFLNQLSKTSGSLMYKPKSDAITKSWDGGKGTGTKNCFINVRLNDVSFKRAKAVVNSKPTRICHNGAYSRRCI